MKKNDPFTLRHARPQGEHKNRFFTPEALRAAFDASRELSTEADKERRRQVETALYYAAEIIDRSLPKGPDKMKAIQALREARFHATESLRLRLFMKSK